MVYGALFIPLSIIGLGRLQASAPCENCRGCSVAAAAVRLPRKSIVPLSPLEVESHNVRWSRKRARVRAGGEHGRMNFIEQRSGLTCATIPSTILQLPNRPTEGTLQGTATVMGFAPACDLSRVRTRAVSGPLPTVRRWRGSKTPTRMSCQSHSSSENGPRQQSSDHAFVLLAGRKTSYRRKDEPTP